LNVQHNCHNAKCSITCTCYQHVKREETLHKVPEVNHNKTNSYIINSGALYSAEKHHQASKLRWTDVTPTEWATAIALGL
ncbi:hypothetical protein CROQUDRAFT_31105, partial [Cronartium quercuum f. sp. fusiforme G11]